jgi:hypothetical protein
MDLITVHDQLNLALGTIAGLRTVPWGVEALTPPAALHAFPESIKLRSVGSGPGAPWQIDEWHTAIVTGRADSRSAVKALSAYVRGSGTKSVTRALEDFVSYTALDGVTVKEVTFDFPEHAGTPYVAAIFHLMISGSAT